MNASCLCGAVRIRLGPLTGPYELCNCNRCKKHTGSAFNSVVDVSTQGYAVISGREKIGSYKAPLIESEPRYQVWFCKNCGSPLPDPDPGGEVVEIPAGIIDDQLQCSPDKSIYIEQAYEWVRSLSGVKQFTKLEYGQFRAKSGRSRCVEISKE